MSIYTLALESSCDETSASVLKDGRTVLSNVISSQVPIHRKFGGVVPEIASRHHIEQVIPVIDQALRDANVTLQDINHIGVTYGPGLVGALLVGVAAAKGLSFATGIPLVPVHHMEGHSFANFFKSNFSIPGIQATIISLFSFNKTKVLKTLVISSLVFSATLTASKCSSSTSYSLTICSILCISSSLIAFVFFISYFLIL